MIGVLPCCAAYVLCHVSSLATIVQCCHAHQRDSVCVSVKYQTHFLHSNEANYPGAGWWLVLEFAIIIIHCPGPKQAGPGLKVRPSSRSHGPYGPLVLCAHDIQSHIHLFQAVIPFFTLAVNLPTSVRVERRRTSLRKGTEGLGLGLGLIMWCNLQEGRTAGS